MKASEVKTNFDIVYQVEQKVAEGVRTWHLKLTPKVKESFKSFEAWIDVDGMPRQLKITSFNGDTTTIELSNLEKNLVISPDTFLIKPPKGTRFIQV